MKYPTYDELLKAWIDNDIETQQFADELVEWFYSGPNVIIEDLDE